MKKYIFTLFFAVVSITAGAWSQKGHDVTAYIAECHLTDATRAAVDSILDGKSLVYWANWLDNASYSMDYAYTKTWHYKNMDVEADPKGDAVTAIYGQIETLKNPDATPADAALAIKILTHVIGDLHQPMHLGNAADRGGNTIKMKFFDRNTNLHSIWDSSLVESGHKWSYTEWQQQIDRATPAAEAQIIAGTPDDWAAQTYDIAQQCYVYFRPGAKVMYNDIARWTPVIEQQLLRGGLRLAHVLNTIFDPAYRAAQ
ncbi:MAG: S1/P1 nuclease [Odoribacter sp.]|nr:S1/P1 nuclease [Odoribacter sp.]